MLCFPYSYGTQDKLLSWHVPVLGCNHICFPADNELLQRGNHMFFFFGCIGLSLLPVSQLMLNRHLLFGYCLDKLCLLFI